MVLSGSHHQSQVADLWTLPEQKSLSESSNWPFNLSTTWVEIIIRFKWLTFQQSEKNVIIRTLMMISTQVVETSVTTTDNISGLHYVPDNKTTLSHVTQRLNNLPFIMSLNPVYRLFSMLLVEMSSSKQEHEPIHMSLSEGLSFKIGNTKKTVTALNVIGQWD